MPSDVMNSILRFTRGGRLQEATNAIQNVLMRKASGNPPESVSPEAAGIALKPRRPLGEVVGQLGKLIPKLLRNRQNPILQIPPGAKFLDGSFTCAAGTRTYKLYVPSVSSIDHHGLLVMLHGCTQNSADFAAGTRMNELAEVEGMLVVYPDQTTSANSTGCWNWFSPRDQVHGSGEPSIIAGITLEIMVKYSVNPKRVFIGGLSAGGAMAVVMGQTYPNLYEAVGVHSGLPYRAANDVISAFAAMRGESRNQNRQLKPRVIVFHGDADKTVHPSNAIAITTFGKNRRSQTISGVSPDGTKYTRTTVVDENNMLLSEHWLLHGIGHAWSGGSKDGSYTDSRGLDSSKLMVEFFMNRSNRGGQQIEH
jgi:poly(hydroxyalkanoate) depolymerase family esterase